MLSKELGLGISTEQPAWGIGELYLTGDKFRANNDYDGHRHSETVSIDDAEIVTNRPNDQINIYRRGTSRRHAKSINELRIIPRLDKQAAASIEKRSADGLVVKIGATRFLVDERTGFVQSASTGAAQDSKEIFQKGRVVHPGGIVFPEAVITCRYWRGELKTIGIDVIEAATFNAPIKDKEFAVNAPAGSRVFDARKKKGEPGYFTRIWQPVPDILTELEPK